MKYLFISLVVIALGAMCIIFENIFYQYVDEDGVLHESLFLPVGVILALLGMAGIVFSLSVLFAKSIKKRNQ